jgi:hypothetical protein
MSTLQVRLNGTPIGGRIEGLESFSVTYSRDEQTGATQKAYTNELKFFDDGFDLIFNTLVASQQGLYKYIKVSIWDECCNDFVYQDFIIKGDSVDYCTGDCFVVARMTREDADERIYDCFKRTPITTDLENPDGSVNNSHWTVDPTKNVTIPQVPYCNELKPVIFYWIILLLGMFVMFFVNIFNFFTLGAIKDIKDWFQENLIGCGRKHPSPRIVDYIGQASAYCGCNQATPFVSSFLTDPFSFYTSTLFVNAPIKPGKRNPPRYIVENRPRQTITEFLNMVASDFNSNWWIENGVLYMERKDFYLGAPILFDAIAESKKGNILNGACFKYNQGILYASIDMKATSDAHEICGNNSLDQSNMFVDFVKVYSNPAGWESWRDVKSVNLSYAPARFRDEESPKSGLDSFPIPAILNLWYGSAVSQSSRYLLLAQDEFTVHKYFEWDGASVTEAQARREPILIWNGDSQSFINIPGGTPNPRYRTRYDPQLGNNLPINQRNIYTDFHAIDDPINNPYRFWDYEIEAKMDCVMVKNLSVNRTVRMQTPYGTTVQGKINTIIANFGDRTIRITGEF